MVADIFSGIAGIAAVAALLTVFYARKTVSEARRSGRRPQPPTGRR
jgi:hypothetical protein